MRPIDAPKASDPSPREREERLARLGRVAGELVHDLAGVLAVLNGRVALARAEASLGRIPGDELTRIGDDAEELRAMVVEVLDELRGVRRHAEVTFPVRATLETVLNRWLVGASQVSASLRTSLLPSASIAGPRTFFSRAIGNLLRNAARHAREEIRVTASPVRGGSWVEIRIEDDGEGVSDALRPRLFEPFVSGSEVGTGLGLSFARWGIEGLGGTLALDDERSGLGGASFRASLPLSGIAGRARGEVDTVERAGAFSGPLRGFRVAVVDDDESVRTTFVRLLGRAGAEARAHDPSRWDSLETGIDALTRFAPTTILLDLTLGPYAGPELTGLLRLRAPELGERVLYFTGGPDPGPLDRPILGKLLPFEQIVERIRAETPL
jgi:CheY-like chemotaxis protein